MILSFFCGVEQHVAQATNLVFFIPTSISAIIVTIKEKLINWSIAIPVAISGIIGAIIGAKISIKTNVEDLKKYFGIFLIMIAIYEIYLFIKKYIWRKKDNNNNYKNDLNTKKI